MFDVGMGEIGLIAIVALLVLGPERLPRAARTAGALVRKARNSWHGVRAEIERELAAEDLKRQMKETAAAIDPRPHLHEAVQSVRDAVSSPNAVSQPDDHKPSLNAEHQPDEHQFSPTTADHQPGAQDASIHPAADPHERS